MFITLLEVAVLNLTQKRRLNIVFGWTINFLGIPLQFFVVIITLHNSCLSTLCSRMCGLLGLFSPTCFITCTLISLNLRILNPISFALLYFLPFALLFALPNWTTESPPLCSVLEKYNCATIFPCSLMPGVQCTNGLLLPEFEFLLELSINIIWQDFDGK